MPANTQDMTTEGRNPFLNYFLHAGASLAALPRFEALQTHSSAE